MSKRGESPGRQRGDILLEALIGVLVAGLVGAGMAHLLARTLDQQRQAAVARLALDGMDRQLAESGVQLCGTSPSLALPSALGDKAIAVACATASGLGVTLDGTSYTVTPPPAMTLTVAAGDLGLDGQTALALGTQQ